MTYLIQPPSIPAASMAESRRDVKKAIRRAGLWFPIAPHSEPVIWACATMHHGRLFDYMTPAGSCVRWLLR